MKIIKRGRTNWKYLFIIFALAVIVGAGVLTYLQWAKQQNRGGPELQIPGMVGK